MQFKRRTLTEIADMICGNFSAEESLFVYRSSKYLTEFFEDCGTAYVHDGSSRATWVAGVLKEILAGPQPSPTAPPETFVRVIQRLMDAEDATNEGRQRAGSLAALNAALAREGFVAFTGADKQVYLRHLGTNSVSIGKPNPHRPFTPAEVKKRELLRTYLDTLSEDGLIEHVLLPLFRQLGFHRITAAGHKDKALEFGKDIWMKFTLPTQHVLYFGIQAKIGKIDAAGATKGSNANVAEIHNQVTMMLGHDIFDPEIGKHALVDHAFIVAGGEITKAARNWLGGKLDASKRSQILFMDRDDILNLFIVTNLPLPEGAIPTTALFDEDQIPF